MAHWLRALVLLEDPSLIPALMFPGILQPLVTPVRDSASHFWPLWVPAYTWYSLTYTHKIKSSEKNKNFTEVVADLHGVLSSMDLSLETLKFFPQCHFGKSVM